MIAACPKCGARYRIEKERLEPAGARLRCSRCEVVFRVRPPRPAEDVPAPVQASAPAPEPTPPAAAPEPAPNAPLVLVGLPDADRGKETGAALRRWGFQVAVYHDGVEALLELQRRKPRVAIVDRELPRMNGLELIECVRRNPELRETRIVFVGAFAAGEFEAQQDEGLTGPDAFIEAADVPDGLTDVFEEFGLPLYQPPRTEPRRPESAAAPAPAAAPPQPAAVPSPAPAPTAAPETASVPAPESDVASPKRTEAERLARIIVSDIVLYNADKFSAALQADDVAEAMQAELEEGRSMFRSRIDESTRNERDFLADELRRVADTRRGA